jgi:adenine-specific DNA-methyltransferase
VRYIGSKEQLLSFIEGAVNERVKEEDYHFGDLFCGTAAVSRLFKQLGKRVTANDSLRLCYVLAKAVLDINEEPQFKRLIESGEIGSTETIKLFSTPYDRVLNYLNEIPGEPGFIYREYSPGGTTNSPHQRQYFSDANAQEIDAIRTQIARWDQAELLNEAEACLLISDLMRATNRVANIAGTYGCFMKRWDQRAHKPLTLQRSRIISSSQRHEVFCTDAHSLAKERYFHVLYLDPPYTWRHYGAYYHILETIARWDEPTVSGLTGLRPWEESKSRYCDRSDAVNALQELVSLAQCKHLFLSYNSEGLITYEQIMEILALRGEPACSEISYRRYRSNTGGTKNKSLKERLYYVQIRG